jgi:hypothetical protein
MAGLLDIFGTSGADTMGLLGMSPADIARNRDDAQAQALYALAGRLFQGGNTGQSIVEGLQRGQQAYKGGMQDTLQSQLQNVQLADMIRKRKQEQQALAEQQRIQGVIQGAVTKPQEIYGEDIMGQRVGEGMTAPRFDLQKAMPQLMSSPEGRRALGELVASEKAMRPDTFSLAEGATQFERDPFTGETKAVATGAQKVAKLTGKEGNVALMFFGTDDVAKLRGIPNAIDKIRLEATIQRKAEQPQINLNDPTAVQTQQLKTLSQWEGALKNSGATETAMRAQGFYAAYAQAKKGNSNADGALIYNVAKVYDPAGAVQAGDVSTVIGVPSMPEVIKKAAQKLTTGGSLTPKERENMKKIIDDVVDERSRMIEPSLNTYRKINRGLGGTDDLIVNPYDSVKKPASLESILGFDRPRGGQ